MRDLFPVLICAMLLISPVALAEEREYIYGAELMTPKERDAYRSGIQGASHDEARDTYRHRHRERLKKRAQQRGLKLDEKGVIRREGAEK